MSNNIVAKILLITIVVSVFVSGLIYFIYTGRLEESSLAQKIATDFTETKAKNNSNQIKISTEEISTICFAFLFMIMLSIKVRKSIN